MNYLGHLLLTYPDEELTMGNLLGDMLRGVQVADLPEGLQHGVTIHHFIDRFTDTHPGVRKLVSYVRPGHGKYAPVVIDVLLDHILTQQWDEHAGISYAEFTSWIYHEVVPSHVTFVHEPVASRIRNMAMHRWLDGYPTETGMNYVLGRMDRRTSFPSRFTAAMDDLRAHRKAFENEFRDFYGELRLRVREMM